MPRHHDCRNLEVIRALAEQYQSVLRSALGGARDVALLDFPNYPNVGDSLIWLGQLAALRTLGVRIRYIATAESFSWRELHRRLPQHAPILFSGGGNLGDQYPRIQDFRTRVLRESSQRPFVQLPQSIHFRSEFEAAGFFETVRRHCAATLLVRDRESATLATSFGVQALLCPDAAFCLGPIPAPEAAQPHVFLLRTDEEKTSRFDYLLAERHGYAVDWIRVPHPGVHSTLCNLTFVAESRRMFPLVAPFLGLIYSILPRARFAFGKQLLAQGEVLVTDRLHGHILATLLGMPNVLLDNSYGKLARFHRTWTIDSPYAFVPREQETLEAVCVRARGAAEMPQ
jgi:exopolysaccharide biosynthesis predicted pyruvyltransferase EpsI